MIDFAGEMCFPTTLSDEEIEELNAPDKLVYFCAEDYDSDEWFDDAEARMCALFA